MEAQEIKQRLTLAMLQQHYGLKADKQNRLKCPFHNDKTPSLQLFRCGKLVMGKYCT